MDSWFSGASYLAPSDLPFAKQTAPLHTLGPLGPRACAAAPQSVMSQRPLLTPNKE